MDKIVPVEVNEHNSEYCKIRENFAFRFGYNSPQENLLAFKNRTFSAIARAVGDDEYKIRFISRKVCKIVAYPYSELNDRYFYGSLLEQVLKLIDIEESKYRFYMWLQILEIVANDSYYPEENCVQQNFVIEVAEALKVSGINAVLCQVGTEYKFYPASEKFLDEKLVIDVLNFLSDYGKAKEQFELALEEYLAGKEERQIVDCLRLSLELFLKQLLGNEKSLENQKSILGKYLENKNISVEIRNMYMQLFDYYEKYNNNHAKHSNNVEYAEIDFLVYLTGSFLRFLITVDNKDYKL